MSEQGGLPLHLPCKAWLQRSSSRKLTSSAVQAAGKSGLGRARGGRVENKSLGCRM